MSVSGVRVSFTHYYEALDTALKHTFRGAPVPSHVLWDWIEEHQPAIVAELRKQGRGDSGSRSWRSYLATAMSRYEKTGRVRKVGTTSNAPAGATRRVATWEPIASTGPVPSSDRTPLTIRLDEATHEALSSRAESTGRSMQSIMEAAVQTYLQNPLPKASAHQLRFELATPTKPLSTPLPRQPMKVAGLFAGIGGFELGLSRAGHETVQLCEIEPTGQAVLKTNFDAELHGDVTTLTHLHPDAELLTGGFPCTDLSQAGKTAGIRGAKSGLVGEVFRLLQKRRVPWILLENVPFMLQLAKGEALEVIVSMFEHLGYKWAYRVVNTQAFGLPQRRKRVLMLASLDGDPRQVLLSQDAGLPEVDHEKDSWFERQVACGFYWTEGVRGLGWADNAVPTLKPGSTIGIASPPAIVFPKTQAIATPNIRDAERLQGFDAGWTEPAVAVGRKSLRWRLVGNAVTVNVAEWVGLRLREPMAYDDSRDRLMRRKRSWPTAGWNIEGRVETRHVAQVSPFPVHTETPSLEQFLLHEPKPLSLRAATGFYKRATGPRTKLKFPRRFLEIVQQYIESVSVQAA